MAKYGHFLGDQTEVIDEDVDWVIDPRHARAHVGHDLTVSIYAGRNLAIECQDCWTLIGDIDFLDDQEDD